MVVLLSSGCDVRRLNIWDVESNKSLPHANLAIRLLVRVLKEPQFTASDGCRRPLIVVCSTPRTPIVGTGRRER